MQSLNTLQMLKAIGLTQQGLVEQGQGLRTTSHQPPTVLFFGDSHVEAFGPRIVDLYSQGCMIQEVGFITSGGCAPIPNVFINKWECIYR